MFNEDILINYERLQAVKIVRKHHFFFQDAEQMGIVISTVSLQLVRLLISWWLIEIIERAHATDDKKEIV